jgi:hypothetical protein
MRRAVMLVNLVNLSLLFLCSVLSISFSPYVSSYIDFEGDGGTQAAPSIRDVIRNSLPMLFGIAGAHVFNHFIVILVGFYYGLNAFLSTIAMNIPAFVIGVVFCYPHVVLAQEINRGTMSEQNYPNEEHSCCCIQA